MRSKDMKKTRSIIEINEELCNGCGECVPACAEGAIQIVDGKAKLVKDLFCDGLGACLRECPKGALTVEEREAEEFDEKAVEEHLSSREKEDSPHGIPMAHGCPSAKLQTFVPKPSGEEPAAQASALSHWPVQIRLVPPTAPFLKGANLLVAADCAPVAYPNFHRDFLRGKAVMVGCPKFDDVQGYVDKFADIFRSANIKSVTVLDMEVPCCSALPKIVKRGMQLAGKSVPLEEVVISARGEILKREQAAA